MKELFSVIITTCNRDVEILREAVESVIKQTYSNIEIIIVNDAPSNQYNIQIEKMVRSYQGAIRYYINERQMGANYSRNLGALKSSGMYLSFLDDDDYWENTRVSKIVEMFHKGYDIVYSDFIIFGKNKHRYSKRENPEYENALELMLSNNYLGGFSNVSFTKQCFIDSKMLDEEMPSYQDQDLFIRMIQIGRIGYIEEALSYYRINENSISLNSKKKLDGLLMLVSKYSLLYEKYPNALRIRLENELVYACKQGWKVNKSRIIDMLKHQESYFRIIYLVLLGTAKNIAVNILKLQ